MIITIIGLGGVGQQLLHSLLSSPQLSGSISEINVICHNSTLIAKAIYDDILSKIYTSHIFGEQQFQNIPLVNFTLNYDCISKTDLLVCCYGIPSTFPLKDRNSLAKDHLNLTNNIFNKIKPFVKEGLIIINSVNPVDIISWHISEVSDVLKERIFGISGAHNTARFMMAIEEVLGCKYSDINKNSLFVVGEHGKYFIPLINLIKIKDELLIDIASSASINKIIDIAKNKGLEIFNSKKSPPCFGPSSAIYELITVLLMGKSSTYCGSIWMQKYNCFLSWPFKIIDGYVTPLEIDLTEDDSKELMDCAFHLINFKEKLSNGKNS
ncbi:hypothetical protein A6J40_01925 [Legionella longbeachae]|uniref:lactate/malate family dehydrogenase n=1 Tax=Legionella longbeachae TaxID=450 RepID=UPI0009B755E8|nr:hypothetical protein [Legionella longbeachae]VEE02719.1 Malate dehydrogenase [Legionella oakridgensis]ARB91019.1 hypothetical protein A6J40_01925 [Legionella longbeachae]ARM32554.1 hypothetical protein B0B39_02990 [Legionella longbeachae]RZV21189.1 hypothetical protein EKG34_17215 [Legionella longbeachae]UAK45780.1 hypothetical protein K8O86_13435 [Legionella longbeachae]